MFLFLFIRAFLFLTSRSEVILKGGGLPGNRRFPKLGTSVWKVVHIDLLFHIRDLFPLAYILYLLLHLFDLPMMFPMNFALYNTTLSLILHILLTLPHDLISNLNLHQVKIEDFDHLPTLSNNFVSSYTFYTLDLY